MLLLKLNRCLRYCLFIALVLIFTSGNLSAQITLGASPYTQDFNTTILPAGWTTNVGASSTNLGGTATPATSATWSSSMGQFEFCASAKNPPLNSGSNATAQNAATDRALAIRATTTFGDGQHSFNLHLTNTTGLANFQLSFNAQLMNIQSKISNYRVDYGVGAFPTTFTPVGATFTDLGINGGVWGNTTINVNFGGALDNITTDVYIRIASLSISGGGSHCTFGIDDVNLSWIPYTLPAVNLTSPNPSVAASSILQGSVNNVISRSDFAVTGSSARLTSANFTTAGSYAATDITNLKLWYQATSTFNGTAILLATNTTGLGAGLQTFNGLFQPIPAANGYLFLTADIDCNATVGANISVPAVNTANFTFQATSSYTATPAPFNGNAQTFLLAAPQNVTAASTTAGNGQLTINWTNIGCFDEILVVATDDAGGVTSVPSGDGTAYTPNSFYNDGTNFVGLNPNEFCIYKGIGSAVLMTGLVNGITYYIKIFTRKGLVWTSGTVTFGTPFAPVITGYQSRVSGPWNNSGTWNTFNGTSWVPASSWPNDQNSDVQIMPGHIVNISASGFQARNLTVDATAKLWCSTAGTNKYLNVFGNILCNGTIGDYPTTNDDLCFNLEATNGSISGTGTFTAARIRKNLGVNITSTYTISMNITTWWNGTAIYNNYTGDPNAFNVTISPSTTVTCANGGSVAIDGSSGTAFGSSYGTFNVNGTLTLTGMLYLTTNNVSPYNCIFNIGTTGIVNTPAVSMAGSTGSAFHTFSIANGGKLNVSGTSGISPFSTLHNNYILSAGSTVQYSASGNEPVESGLSYSNLTISGTGIKTTNGNVAVGKTFLLSSSNYNQNVGIFYYTTTIAAAGALTGNGGNFVAGDAGGTISFTGNGSINGTTALGFNVLKVNAGTVTNTLTAHTCDTLNLTGGIFTIGTGLTFNMLASGVVTATAGNFATGATGGILNFQGAGKFIGNCSPYDVYTSGGVDFGGGTVTIQNGGSFRINAGGFANTNGCFYANGSTLVYNNGSTFGAGTEWYALFASGRGVPYNVQIGTSAVINTKVDFGGSSAWRQMNGNLFIGPAAGGSGYGLILGSLFGGDIIVGGNWTRTAATSTFTHNTRAVTFNGASSSTVSVLGVGTQTETFAYLIINKSSGVSVIQAAVPNSTNITVNGSGGSNTLQMVSGDLDLNQQTFNFTSWFNLSQNDLGIDGTSGNLTRNINSTGGPGVFAVYNSDPGTHFITVSRMSGNASVLVLGSTVTITTGGLGAGGGGINFGNSLTTVNGTLQINSYGYVTGFAPTYGTNSFLVYNSGGSFDRNVEWGSLSGPGYPYHVVVQNGTNIRLNTPATNGDADRAIAGNLSIVAGSSLLLSTTAINTLTVGKNVVLDGTLTLPTVIGGDLYIGGNWNRSATGVFVPNDRAVFFNGSTASTITANGGQLFLYLYLAKNALATTLTLLDDIYITKEFGVTSGTFDLAAKDATLKSDATGTANFGKVGATGDVSYSAAGRFIVERYIPTGTLAGQHLKSWQLLAVPDNGGQTINAGWQEGNVLPTVGVGGLGTIITNNIAGAGFDIIGGVGPSMKTFDPLTATWVGVPNTTPTALFNKKGYFLFVRGDRTVSSYLTTANVTTLRSRGKLFVPGSNPPATTTVLAGKFETIGNPYASAIDFLNVTKPVAPAVDDVFYVWDPLLYGFFGYGGYQTISSSNGYKPNPGGTANYSNAVAYTKIQSGQAFFVHATGAGGVVSFTENAKLSGSNMVFKSTTIDNSNRQYFRAQLYTSTGYIADANVVAFSPTFNNAYESNDALKIQNVGENFGIRSNDQDLAIEARSPVQGTDTIHYLLNNLRTAVSYQFRFGPENMAATNIKGWLVDKYLHAYYPVSLSDSSFFDFTITADPASAAADRFMLVFKRKRSLPGHFDPNETTLAEKTATSTASAKANANSLGNALAAEISVYPNPVVNKTLQVSFRNKLAGNYQLQLLNSAGQVTYEQRIAVNGNHFTKSILIAAVPAGYYSLVIIGEDGSKKLEGIVVE